MTPRLSAPRARSRTIAARRARERRFGRTIEVFMNDNDSSNRHLPGIKDRAPVAPSPACHAGLACGFRVK
jgi:hypothetical protein